MKYFKIFDKFATKFPYFDFAGAMISRDMSRVVMIGHAKIVALWRIRCRKDTTHNSMPKQLDDTPTSLSESRELLTNFIDFFNYHLDYNSMITKRREIKLIN